MVLEREREIYTHICRFTHTHICIHIWFYDHIYIYNMYMYTYANVIIHTYIHTYIYIYIYTYIYIHVYIANVQCIHVWHMWNVSPGLRADRPGSQTWQMADGWQCNETFNEIQEKGRNGRRLRIWQDMSWPFEPRQWVSIGESMQTHLQANHIDSVNDWSKR